MSAQTLFAEKRAQAFAVFFVHSLMAEFMVRMSIAAHISGFHHWPENDNAIDPSRCLSIL